MTAFLSAIDSHKTYIVCVATIAYAVLGFYLKTIDMNTMMEMIFAAAGGAGMRSAVQKAQDAATISATTVLAVPVTTTTTNPTI